MAIADAHAHSIQKVREQQPNARSPQAYATAETRLAVCGAAGAPPGRAAGPWTPRWVSVQPSPGTMHRVAPTFPTCSAQAVDVPGARDHALPGELPLSLIKPGTFSESARSSTPAQISYLHNLEEALAAKSSFEEAHVFAVHKGACSGGRSGVTTLN